MFKTVLTLQQTELLPLLEEFSDSFGLAGGTAIALHLGHRRSIDFDLFTSGKLDHDRIRRTIRSFHSIDSTIVESPDELTLVTRGVKLTFLSYPFPIEYSEQLDNVIRMPDVMTLAAMKTFSLGRRAKWKDYVDLYFVFKTRSLPEILQRSRSIFQKEFNEKLFREQLAFYEDIDYSETIDFMPGFEVNDEEVKETLQKIAIQR